MLRGSANNDWQVWRDGPHLFQASLGQGAAEREACRDELLTVLHESFIDHPDYDAEHLPEFLGADIFLRAETDHRPAGFFTADLLRVRGEPVVHFTAALVTPSQRSQGRLMRSSMGLTLDLARQAFGDDHFYAGLRTANPRVVAKLWNDPWVRYFPRPDWDENDPRVAALRPLFCGQTFGADRCDLTGEIFYDIYPALPWRGRSPLHHDPKVNQFCASHLRPEGRDAFLFLGPTLPPLVGIPRDGFTWPVGFFR